jgi:hypothetical protein
MKTSRIAAAVLVALLSSSVPRLAAAQDDAVTVQARARFKEGVDFYDKGQFENARLAFLQAYALKKHPAVLLNLAQSSARSGHPLEAAKSFQTYLHESTSASPQQRTDAEAGLAEVRQKIGRIEIIAQAGTEITLDEKERLGTTPFGDPIDVEPGSHSLRSSTETVRVTVNAGQKVVARFGGAPAAVVAPPVPAPGGSTSPPETTPPSDTPPVTAPPAETSKHTNLLSPPATMTPVYVGLAVGGVGLLGTIIFAVAKADAQSKADSVAANIRDFATGSKPPLSSSGICSNGPVVRGNAQLANACQTLKDNNDKVNTDATLANVSVVVMVVGVATAAGWYLFAPKRDDQPATTGSRAPLKPTATVTPYAGYGNGGLLLSGTF